MMKHIVSLILTLLATLIQAVEVGPYKVTKVVDGDTIKVMTDLGEQTIRILYVDTPESQTNSHGKKMPEGIEAKEFLQEFISIISVTPNTVTLWAPGTEIKKDRYNRLLAIPCVGSPPALAGFDNGMSYTDETQRIHGVPLTFALISTGRSPYWRKYGDAPEPLHSRLLHAAEASKKQQNGVWKTAPKYMTDKSNERTAPKDPIKAMNTEIIQMQYANELKKHPTHTHWLSNEKRHNKKCRWFGATKGGAFGTADKGVACKVCGG